MQGPRPLDAAMMQAAARPRMRREVLRKFIHVSSVALPLFVWVMPRAVGLAVLVPLAGIALSVDVTRLRFRGPRYYFLRTTRTLLRHHERRGLAGATYMAVAYALALLVLPKPVAVAAMLYNGLGDAAAALVGKRFGRHRTRWGKSWEGFAAALMVCLGVGLVVPGVSLAGAVLGAVTAATLEFLPLPLDDNVRVTLGGGLACFIGTTIF